MNVMQQLLAMCVMQGHTMKCTAPRVHLCTQCGRQLGITAYNRDGLLVAAALRPCGATHLLTIGDDTRAQLIDWIKANGGL